MKKHEPIKLGPSERADLGSITKHPGMEVLIERILKGHADQQLLSVLEIEPDDEHRSTKIDAISSVAYAMKLTLELVKKELERNWSILEEAELRRRREIEAQEGQQ